MEILRDHVAHEVGPIAKPTTIEFVDSLPKTRSGKIMRRVLKARALGTARRRFEHAGRIVFSFHKIRDFIRGARAVLPSFCTWTILQNGDSCDSKISKCVLVYE